jgi:hypothetical protein
MGGKVVYAGKGGPGYEIYVGLRMDTRRTPGGRLYPASIWRNPFVVGEHVETREEAVEAFKEYIHADEQAHLLVRVGELKGKTLGCWCAGVKDKGKPHIPNELTAEVMYPRIARGAPGGAESLPPDTRFLWISTRHTHLLLCRH